MNEKFFALAEEKQQRIINAAYRVFSQNSYQKAPMSEIAAEAQISKALLFHYFTNKRALYMFLWESALALTRQTTKAHAVLETEDFFDMLRRSLTAKCALMRAYPHIYAFCLNAYYEEQPDIKEIIQKSYAEASLYSETTAFAKMDKAMFRDDIDLHLMYEEIFYAMDGYMHTKYRLGEVIPEDIEVYVGRMIDLWETVYKKG